MKELFLAFFTVAFAIGILVGHFFTHRATHIFVKKNVVAGIRFGSQVKPITGGVMFFEILLLAVAAVLILPGFTTFNSRFIAMLTVMAASFGMGLADDLLNTSPMFKFLIQVVCAIILIWTGTVIQVSPSNTVNYCITILWVIGIMNSINMLDNMDAITTLTTISIVGGAIIFSLFVCDTLPRATMAILTALLGALMSFLFFNWNPAKMYMGDNGSQLLGIILAYIGIVFFWNHAPTIDYANNTTQFIIIANAFVVPLCDTTTVTINRLLQGKSPFIGDKNHTTHHLYYLGLSVKQVGILLFAINAVGVLIALSIIYRNVGHPEIRWYAIYPILVFLFLYINTKIPKHKANNETQK